MKNAKQQVRSPYRRSTGRRWLAIPVAAAMALAACGQAEDEVTAGIVADEVSDADDSATTTPGDDSETDDARDGDAPADPDGDNGDTGEDGAMEDGAMEDGDGPIRTESFDEVLSAQPAEIDEIVALDDTTLGVRFVNAAEPCARARVTVTETAGAVEVALETGLHPNAAAMSCIAAVMTYEIPVALDDPIGDRELIAVPSTAGSDGGDDGGGDDAAGNGDDEADDGTDGPGDDVSDDLSGYVGLSEPEAEAKALQEGREYRVERRDGEDFALTMDFNPTRVNVTIEGGVIVSARTG